MAQRLESISRAAGVFYVPQGSGQLLDHYVTTGYGAEERNQDLPAMELRNGVRWAEHPPP